MTDNSQGSDPLARIANALFPECRVEIQTRQAWNSKGGPAKAGAVQAGKIREGAATETDRSRLHGD